MKQLHAIVDSLGWLTPTILGLRLIRPDSSTFFRFQPGQYASINFPDYQHLNGYRSFSIASSPAHEHVIDFGIRVNGPYTKTLQQLRPGDRATVQGPFGKFTTRGIRNRPIVLLAGGIGVTPFMSMIRAAADLQLPTPITLLFSNRTIAETPYRDEMLAMTKLNDRFRILFAVSNESIDQKTPHTIAGMLTGETIMSTVGDSFWGSVFFLCGPAPFMNAMERTLIKLGIERNKIRTESFSVKPGALFEAGSPWPRLIFAGWGTAAAVAVGLVATQTKKSVTTNTPETVVNTSVALPTNTNVPLLNTNVFPTTNTGSDTQKISNATTPKNTNTVVATNTSRTKPPTTTNTSTPTAVKPKPAPVVSTPSPQPIFNPQARQS